MRKLIMKGKKEPIIYAELCRKCKDTCKQNAEAKIVKCPFFNPIYKSPKKK